MSEWIKCIERLPEDFQDVILTDGNEVYLGWYFLDENSNHQFDTYDRKRFFYDNSDITHWMPLPEPPEVT